MCSNDEPLFVELMVSDLSASLIKAEEKTDNEVESRSSTTRKRCTATPSKSSATEPSRKKQKGKNRSRPSLTTKGFKRHFANHDYYDYARVKPSQFELDSLKTSRGGVHNPFPVVLHNMMEEAAEKEFSGIVSWQTHGRAFLISDPKIFVAKVMLSML